MAIDKKAIKSFAKRWEGIGYEKGDTQKFWLQLVEALGYLQSEDIRFEYHLPGGGFIDVWLRDCGVLIEQKSIEVDLDKPEPRQGKLKTPLEQALDYVVDLPLPEQPKYIITCNFRQFRIYDREKYGRSELANNVFEFTLSELAERPDYLNIIVAPENSRLEKEKQVSIEAGRLIAQLYDLLKVGYIDPDSAESQHALNVLCVRLVFCLYCEDADLFKKDAFYNYLKEVPAQNIRMNLKRLFKALDTPYSDRDPYDTAIKDFPYVNGGLFKEDTEIPNFSEQTKDFLLNKVSAPVNWSRISPTIFGGIFESTLNPETRREGGMHYTSPENIHKVIDPLFLDDLKREFTDIRDNNELTPRQKKNRYMTFHNKLCSLKFLDPASGSGNFLTETYLCLRKLEDQLLMELMGGQATFGFEEDEDKGKRVSLNQFYGIEINDFAVTVAETALWISRLKANGEESMLLSLDNDFPLSERPNIVHANALRKDWNEVLPANECSYIIGNPPYKGAHSSEQPRTPEQTADLKYAFDNAKSIAEADFVAAWLAVASKYFNGNYIPSAFVTTNSIGQGQQPGLIWPYLWEKGVAINFAYQYFLWGNGTNDPAAVAVTIVGFSNRKTNPKYFYTDYKSGEIKDVVDVDNIGPYLYPANDSFVVNRTKPLCDVPELFMGNQPIDDGHFIFSTVEEKDSFIREEPAAEKYIHPFLGSREFINNKIRWILWLGDLSDDELDKLPKCKERVERVKHYRETRDSKATQQLALRPKNYNHEMIPKTKYIVIPEVSSQRRKYIPIGYLEPSVFCSNKLKLIESDDIYLLGILMSQFHNAWMRTVAGRMKSDYSYSTGVVYNNFIWPHPSREQKEAIERLTQSVLDVRGAYADKSLAELYDPDMMPADLLEAHKALDKAVEVAYGVDFDGDEEKIVAYLFELYSQKTQVTDN